MTPSGLPTPGKELQKQLCSVLADSWQPGHCGKGPLGHGYAGVKLPGVSFADNGGIGGLSWSSVGSTGGFDVLSGAHPALSLKRVLSLKGE